MNDEAESRNALMLSYPRLFPKPVVWGLEIGDGWMNIVELLCARINAIVEDDPAASFEVMQVKEKFGKLRFYYQLKTTNESIQNAACDAVRTAETASAKCCERCGQRGQRASRNGWMSTRCADCDEF